jgi:hypothetical protein
MENRIAIHEAGHAVLAFHLDIKLAHVSIEPAGLGICRPAVPGKAISPNHKVLFYVAGCVAEEVHLGQADENGCRRDLHNAELLMPLLRSDLSIEDMLATCWRCLTQPRPRQAVQGLARALVDRKTLTGQEAFDIYFDAASKLQFPRRAPVYSFGPPKIAT